MRTVFRFAVLIALIGCEYEDIRTPAITVVVDNSIIYGKQVDAWAFLSDNSGNIYDTRQLSDNAIVEMRALHNAPQLNLTVVYVSKEVEHNFFIRTYSDLPRHTKFHLRELDLGSLNQEPIGSLNVTLQNYNESEFPQGAIIVSAPDQVSYSPSSFTHTNSTFSGSYNLFQQPHKVLISSFRSGKPVYTLLGGPLPSSNIVIDFNQMAEAEATLTLQTEDCEISAIADESYFGYSMAGTYERYLCRENSRPYTVGYPPGFNKYFTRIRRISAGKVEQIEKRGSPITELEFPTLTYRLVSPDVLNPELEVSNNTSHVLTYWTDFETTSWLVYGPKTMNLAPTSIPNSITNKYPSIAAISSLQLFEIALYKVTGQYDGSLGVYREENKDANFDVYSQTLRVK
jgi:hypothetical protein